MESLIVTIFFIVAIISCGYYIYHFCIPHTYYRSTSISADATIVDINHERERWGKNRHIKTIVRFSDGFEYHTFQHRYVPFFIYVDNDVVRSIVTKATKAHDRIVLKNRMPIDKDENCPKRNEYGYEKDFVPDFLKSDFITEQYWEEYAQDLGISKETALHLINQHRQIKSLPPIRITTEHVDSVEANTTQVLPTVSGKIRKPVRKKTAEPEIYINDRKKASYDLYTIGKKPQE